MNHVVLIHVLNQTIVHYQITCALPNYYYVVFVIPGVLACVMMTRERATAMVQGLVAFHQLQAPNQAQHP